MEKVKEVFMKPLFWGITVGHLFITVLAILVSLWYSRNYAKN